VVPNSTKEKNEVFHFKRRLAFVAVPATLALGAVSYGSVVAMAAPSPTPTAATQPSTAEPAESSTEAPETAAEAAEPNEPALPGGGYADPANTQADTQQEGVN
jgi:hypothetical protein